MEHGSVGETDRERRAGAEKAGGGGLRGSMGGLKEKNKVGDGHFSTL